MNQRLSTFIFRYRVVCLPLYLLCHRRLRAKPWDLFAYPPPDPYCHFMCWLGFFAIPMPYPSLTSSHVSVPTSYVCVLNLILPSLYDHPLIFLRFSFALACVLLPRPPMAYILTNIIPLFCVCIMVPHMSWFTAHKRVRSPTLPFLEKPHPHSIFLLSSGSSVRRDAMFYHCHSTSASTIHFSTVVVLAALMLYLVSVS